MRKLAGAERVLTWGPSRDSRSVYHMTLHWYHVHPGGIEQKMLHESGSIDEQYRARRGDVTIDRADKSGPAI